MFGLPRLYVSAPGPEQLSRLRQASESEPLSYTALGATRLRETPAGFVADDDEIVLGEGRELFARASAEVARWSMFDLPWIRMFERQAPKQGQTVAFASRQLGLWTVHTCRVVYCVDEPDAFGFAYGTLRTHAVMGEERFLVRRDPHSDRVTFGIFKFSAPALPAVRMMGALARHLQRRFSVEACDAVLRAVSDRPVPLRPAHASAP